MRKVILLILTLSMAVGICFANHHPSVNGVVGYGDFGATMTTASHPTRVQYTICFERPIVTPEINQSRQHQTTRETQKLLPPRYEVVKQKQIQRFDGEWVDVGKAKTEVKLPAQLTKTEIGILKAQKHHHKEKKAAKKKRNGKNTDIVFILDRSGSMSGLESDTIGGFNSMLEKQKKEDGTANVTTILFDDEYEVLHDRVSIGKMEPMTENQYFVRGSTALLDAVGKTIQKEKAEADSDDNVIFIIITDGLENASMEYDYGQVKNLVEAQKEKGWEFIFLGANIDAVSEAAKVGISSGSAAQYKSDSHGTQLNYEGVNDAISDMRQDGEVNSNWKESIEDYAQDK